MYTGSTLISKEYGSFATEKYLENFFVIFLIFAKGFSTLSSLSSRLSVHNPVHWFLNINLGISGS